MSLPLKGERCLDCRYPDCEWRTHHPQVHSEVLGRCVDETMAPFLERFNREVVRTFSSCENMNGDGRAMVLTKDPANVATLVRWWLDFGRHIPDCDIQTLDNGTWAARASVTFLGVPTPDVLDRPEE